MTARPSQLSVKQTDLSLPTLSSKMGFNASKQHDPIQKIEKSMTAFNADIGHNGDSLYNPEEFCIVHKFESDDDKQRRENEESGLGDLTNAQICIIQDYNFYETYEEDNDWLGEAEDYNHYGYPDQYNEQLASGEMVDDGMTCRLGPASSGASFASSHDSSVNYFDNNYEDDMADETQLDFNEGDTEYESAADSYEAANDPQFGEDASPESLDSSSSPSSPAKSKDMNLSTQFGKASSPSEEAEPDAPAAAPVANAPAPVAANNQSFQMSA